MKWRPENLPNAGQWARARRGLYKGDLALVLRPGEGNDIMEIAVVPRLSYGTQAASNMKRKRKIPRPNPSIFNADMQSPLEIESKSWPPVPYIAPRDAIEARRPESLHEGEVPLKVCVQHKGATYVGGLLIKKVCGKDYRLELSPTKEEMLPFVYSRIRPDVVLPQFVWLHLKVGDKVMAHGYFHGATGIIADVMAQSALVRLDVDLQGNANTSNDCVEIPLSELHRRWKSGDAIKVIAGTWVGKAGHVITFETEPAYVQFLDNDSMTSVSLFFFLQPTLY